MNLKSRVSIGKNAFSITSSTIANFDLRRVARTGLGNRGWLGWDSGFQSSLLALDTNWILGIATQEVAAIFEGTGALLKIN